MAQRSPVSMQSSLLVERGVPMRAMEDAIARQVVHGGDLATNLLEVGGAQESALLSMLAEIADLPAAPAGKLPLPSPTVLRLVPSDLALRHGIFPLALSHGVLVIATAEPLSDNVEEDLSFALAVDIQQKIALLPRIRQAIADAYQLPLERRYLRLVAKLEDRPDPSPTIVPPRPLTARPPPEPERPLEPFFAAPQPPTQTPPTLLAGTAPPRLPTRTKVSAGVEPPPPRAERVDLEKTAETNMDGVIAAAAVLSSVPPNTPEIAVISPLSPVLQLAPLQGDVAEILARPLTSEDMPETIAAPPDYGLETDEEPAPVSRRSDKIPRRAEQPPRARALLSVLRRAVVGERKNRASAIEGGEAEGLPARRRRVPARARRKGPFTTAMAEEELERVTTNDAVLDVFFAFAQQFFEYTALFLVQGDTAEGRDASGPGAGAARLMSLAIRLDRPSLLALARDRRAPVVAPPSDTGADAELFQDLARESRFESGARASVVVLPIVVRHRVVALLLGDDGALDVELSAIGDVVAIAGLTAEHIERAILRKKLGATGEDAGKPRVPKLAAAVEAAARPDARHVGMAALARALELPARAPDAAARAEASPPLEIEVKPEEQQVTAAATSPSPFAQSVPVHSSVAITLPSASAMHPVFARAAEVAKADGTASEVSFADVAEDLSALSPAPAAVLALGPPNAEPSRPGTTGATGLGSEGSASASKVEGAAASADAISAEHKAFLEHAGAESWDIGPRSRSGPPSRRRRTPLGVVSASARARAIGQSTTPPPPLAETKPAVPGQASEKVWPAPLPQGMPGPRLVHRRAVAPSFGARSKSSGGLGAQPLPKEPPPNAIAAPQTPRTPFPPATPVGPIGTAPAPGPVRVPPRVEADTPAPPETLPGPPLRGLEEVAPLQADTSALRLHPSKEVEEMEGAALPARTLPPVVSTEPISPAQAPSPSIGATPPTLVAPFAPARPEAETLKGTWTSERPGSTLPGTRVRAPGPDPVALLQRYLDPNQGNIELYEELVRLGEDAMPAIIARFPGPMVIDPLKARAGLGATLRAATRGAGGHHADLPPASRCGPLLAVLVGIGRSAIPFLTNRSTSGDPDMRFWATHVFAELPFLESAKVILERLFDEDASVRRVARRAASALIAALPSIESSFLPMLDRTVRTNTERPVRRLLAIETLSELGIPKAVPVLIAALADPNGEIAEAAHRALVHVTKQDFRRDARKWVDWWTANASRHRTEWLIAALVHESAMLRSAAAEELAPLVNRDLGYYDDLPPDERQVAQARYQLWWEKEGKRKA